MKRDRRSLHVMPADRYVAINGLRIHYLDWATTRVWRMTSK